MTEILYTEIINDINITPSKLPKITNILSQYQATEEGQFLFSQIKAHQGSINIIESFGSGQLNSTHYKHSTQTLQINFDQLTTT
jgi:hypothetical protein